MVQKEYVTVKKTALEDICLSLIGAPVEVVKGYIRKLEIDVPWSKLLSKPCEIYLDDIHIVLRGNPNFDINFAKKMLLRESKIKFASLLDNIRVILITCGAKYFYRNNNSRIILT